METTVDIPVRTEPGVTKYVANGVERVLTVFVNAYLLGNPGEPWILVDTGLPGFATKIRHAAEARFGMGARPEAIVLTHGHFDHAGSAKALADYWGVPLFAHPLELPYLTGESAYPPQDPTVGGALGLMSRTFPHGGTDLGERVRGLPDDGSVPGVRGWRWLFTPGHTAGHISLFRDEDAALIAGDALATVDQDSAMAMITQTPVLSVPPAPLTTDWIAARASVERLAELRPRTLAAGHGRPVRGTHVAGALDEFAKAFTPPKKGRYVLEPARADERGVVYVPPPVRDPLPRQLLTVGVAAAAVYALVRRRD